MRNPYPLIVGFVACWIVGYIGLLLSPANGTAVWMVLCGIGPGAFPVLLALIGLRIAHARDRVALSGHGAGPRVRARHRRAGRHRRAARGDGLVGREPFVVLLGLLVAPARGGLVRLQADDAR